MHQQYLNLPNNHLDNLDWLLHLVHLRELRVDDKHITTIDGITELDGLISFSARRNQTQAVEDVSVDFSDGRESPTQVLHRHAYTFPGMPTHSITQLNQSVAASDASICIPSFPAAAFQKALGHFILIEPNGLHCAAEASANRPGSLWSTYRARSWTGSREEDDAPAIH